MEYSALFVAMVAEDGVRQHLLASVPNKGEKARI